MQLYEDYSKERRINCKSDSSDNEESLFARKQCNVCRATVDNGTFILTGGSCKECFEKSHVKKPEKVANKVPIKRNNFFNFEESKSQANKSPKKSSP